MNNKVLEELRSSSNEIEVLNKYNVIFMYELSDAFGIPLSIVYATSDKENNLCFIKDDELYSTINIDGLNEVLLKYKSFNEVKDILVPSNGVMDGYINKIYFKINDKWYIDQINNLAYYENEVVLHNKHLNEFVNLLDDVLNALYKENKNVIKYFVTTDK